VIGHVKDIKNNIFMINVILNVIGYRQTDPLIKIASCLVFSFNMLLVTQQ